MELKIDKKIYNDACIAKAVYALADRYTIERHTLSEAEELWTLDEDEEKEAKRMIVNTLNDYRLRCIIEKETHDIRTILYAKSFADCDDIDEHDLD